MNAKTRAWLAWHNCDRTEDAADNEHGLDPECAVCGAATDGAQPAKHDTDEHVKRWAARAAALSEKEEERHAED